MIREYMMGKRKEATNAVWVYMDDEMKALLHKMANEDKLSMSSFVRKLISREDRLKTLRKEMDDRAVNK